MRHTSLVLITLVSGEFYSSNFSQRVRRISFINLGKSAAVSIHAAPMNGTGMTATPSEEGPDLSLQRVARCVPNALLSAESAVDSLARNWYLNNTYFLPDLLTELSVWVIKLVSLTDVVLLAEYPAQKISEHRNEIRCIIRSVAVYE